MSEHVETTGVAPHDAHAEPAFAAMLVAIWPVSLAMSDGLQRIGSGWKHERSSPGSTRDDIASALRSVQNQRLVLKR
jgi:hypothetical protein